jgi:transposase
MQDNAPIYTALQVRDWSTDNSIPVLDWPPYTLDLNPIEHVWWHLENKVLELHPELEQMGDDEGAKKAMEDALIEAWHSIESKIIRACPESMCRRRECCDKGKRVACKILGEFFLGHIIERDRVIISCRNSSDLISG